MTICLLCVGKPKDAEVAALHDRYAERLGRLGVRYTSDWVAQVRLGGRYTPEHAREREARALLDRVDSRHTLVALDSSGDLLDSAAFAARFEGWAARAVTFVVGGPSGLHPSVLSAARFRWSLSRLTFPHELVRVVVTEQIYRAVSSLRGLPYPK